MNKLPILKNRIEEYNNFWILALYNLIACFLTVGGFLLLMVALLPLYFLIADGTGSSLDYYLALIPFILLGAIFIWRGSVGIRDGIKAYLKKDASFRTKFLTSFLPIALVSVGILIMACLIIFGLLLEPVPSFY